MSQQLGIIKYSTTHAARRARAFGASVARALGKERERWILWVPVFCGMGIGFYFSLNFEPALWAGPLLLALAGLLLFLTRKHESQNYYFLTLIFIPVFVFSAGFSAAQFATWSADRPMLTKEIGPVDVSGQVVQVEHRPKSKRITLGKLHISTLAPDKTPNSVRVVLMGSQPKITSGDWVRVRATLKPPSPPASPGAFDFQRQSYFRGLGGVGFSFGTAIIEGRAPSVGAASVPFIVERMRGNINLIVRSVLDGGIGGVASALMTGDRSAIPKEIMNAMRNSGLAHLLAISGLHVGLVAGILFFSVRVILVMVPGLALRYPVKKWAAIAAMAGALAYAFISGTTIPTQRAFLMLAFVLLAVVFDRQGISMRVVAWAAMAILLTSPESILGASFQLSFAAVVALVAFYEEFRDRDKRHNRQKSHFRKISYYVVGVALTTLVAGLATAPFAAFHFNSVATFGLIANLVAVPVTALWIMPAAVSAFVLMPLGLEDAALQVMGVGVEVVIWVAKIVSEMPGAVRVTPAFPMWGLGLVVMGGLWAAIWRGKIRIAGFPIIILGMTSSIFLQSPDILVSSNAKLAAVQTDGGGYTVSTLSRARFERNIWLRRAGLYGVQGKWPKNGKTNGVSCDAIGCIYQKSGHKVSFAKTAQSFAEDCASAVDILFALKKGIEVASYGQKHQCPEVSHLISVSDLKKNGTYAIWLNDDGIKVETVNQRRGNRPWIIKGN